MQGLTGRCLGDARDQGDLSEQKTTANFEQLLELSITNKSQHSHCKVLEMFDFFSCNAVAPCRYTKFART